MASIDGGDIEIPNLGVTGSNPVGCANEIPIQSKNRYKLILALDYSSGSVQLLPTEANANVVPRAAQLSIIATTTRLTALIHILNLSRYVAHGFNASCLQIGCHILSEDVFAGAVDLHFVEGCSPSGTSVMVDATWR